MIMLMLWGIHCDKSTINGFNISKRERALKTKNQEVHKMFNIVIQGERIKQLSEDKTERSSYKRIVSADSLDELDERLNEIPEMAVIRESRGIHAIERISSIKIA